MQGEIVMWTPTRQKRIGVAVENGRVKKEEVAEKMAYLKEVVRKQPTTPFVVFLQLPSKMNQPGFKAE